MEPLLRLDNVSFGYGADPVLRSITLGISRGEIISLLGPNGSGKSTLIKVMLGILSPSKGHVSYCGNDVAHLSAKSLAREMAYVPQMHRSTFPYRVIDVALMGRIPHKTFFFKYSKDDLDIAYDALRRLSILHLAERAYTEISGGERQLTIIARALTQGAKTLLMDEPASGLDYGNQLRLLDQVGELSREGYTFIKSTHSPEHALWIADRAIMIREGSIVADGTSANVVNSESLRLLYGVKVNVVRVNGTHCTCVPAGTGRHGLVNVTDEASDAI